MDKNEMAVGWSGVGSAYTGDEIKLVSEIMKETRDTFTQGKYLKEFEQRFCEYNGNEFAFAVSSCTGALELAAKLSKVGPGDEVIIPAHTFCATAVPFGRTGAKIVWADIDSGTWNISAETIRDKLSERTKAVVVVHLYGLAAEMEEIMELAKEQNLTVIEDCAQALGATCDGKKVGTWGDFACFSFHTHKNITTLGEGGMLTVKDPETAKIVPGLRHNGCCLYPEPRDRYWVPAMSNVDLDLPEVWPYNFCIGEVQCALGTAVLGRLDDQITLRRKRTEEFKNSCQNFPELVFQKIPSQSTSSHHLLPARYENPNKTNHDFIQLMFSDYNVKVIVQYYPLNRYPLFEKMGFGEAACPTTDDFFDNMVSFPFHSWMPDEEFQYMLNSTLKALEQLH